MPNKLKRLILKITGISVVLKRVDILQQQNWELARQNHELLKATIFNNSIIDSKWLRDKSFSPGGWAVDYAFLYTLYRVLNAMHPRSIVEFGLGQSSKLIHQYAGFYNDVEAVTCEHDPEWIQFFQKSTDADYVFNIKLLELADVIYREETTLSYKDVGKAFEEGKFDLIVVDAPFGSKRYSRSQVLELVKTNLSETFCIMIDDYNRAGEQETGQELMKLLNEEGIKYVSTIYSGSKQHLLVCSENLKFLTTM